MENAEPGGRKRKDMASVRSAPVSLRPRSRSASAPLSSPRRLAGIAAQRARCRPRRELGNQHAKRRPGWSTLKDSANVRSVAWPFARTRLPSPVRRAMPCSLRACLLTLCLFSRRSHHPRTHVPPISDMVPPPNQPNPRPHTNHPCPDTFVIPHSTDHHTTTTTTNSRLGGLVDPREPHRRHFGWR